MSISVTLSGQACGATVTDVDLSTKLSPTKIVAIKHALYRHQVLVFPDQHLTDDDLEQLGSQFGPMGIDPYVEHVEDHEHIMEIRRATDEVSPVFAEDWHTDYSFLPSLPDATMLYSIAVPNKGGDTLFANQPLALDKMPAAMRSQLQGLRATHSAKEAYSSEGIYGNEEVLRTYSIKFKPSEKANETCSHPVLANHPHTGQHTILGCLGNIIALEDKGYIEGLKLLMELRAWQTREEFLYRHKWQPNMLVIWDNHSVLHRATGGYDGQERIMHRITVSSIT